MNEESFDFMETDELSKNHPKSDYSDNSNNKDKDLKLLSLNKKTIIAIIIIVYMCICGIIWNISNLISLIN